VKALYARCEECPLKEEPHALGTGPEQADVVVIGEAPGVQEARTGVPFVGPSGKLLDAVLQQGGIDRKDVYVTNVCLCRPEDNAAPPNTAIRACHDRLVHEVRGRHPKSLLLLGNTAAKSVLDTRTGITEVRTWMDSTSPYFPGVRVVSTFHPAAALRNGDYLPSILTDVKKLTRIEVGWEYTQFEVAQDETWLDKQAESSKTMALDIEVGMEGDFRRVDAKHPEFLCIGIAHQPGHAVIYPKHVVDSDAFKDKLNRLFETDIRWVMQNGKFDIQFLWGGGVPSARVDEDTMLMHYSIDERKGTHDLESLAVEYLNAPRYKTDAKQFLPRKGASLAYLPERVLHEYNAADADVTLRLVDPLWKEVESDGVTKPYRELLIPGSNALARAEYVGVKVDRDRLHDLDASLGSRLAKAREGLSRWVANPNSPQQVKVALSGMGIEVESTNKEHLNELVKRGGAAKEFATALLDYRADAKLLSTYVRGLGQSLVRSRIHPTFLLHGTETGRLSCRRPNLQNIPSGSLIRDAFVAGPENVLLNADYSQIEFRLAAVFSHDAWLLEQFRQDRAFHKEVARSLFGDNYTDLQYLRAKAVNFGILYGRGAKSLWEEHGGKIQDWQSYIDDFHRAAPYIRPYQKDLHRQIRERGYLESYYERKRRFWLVTRENWHVVSKEGLNFPLQSTGSDLTLKSLIRLEPLLRGKAAPVITVHDNLMFEVRKQYLEEVIHTVREVMEDTDVSDICPTPVEIKIGQRWGSLHAEGN